MKRYFQGDLKFFYFFKKNFFIIFLELNFENNIPLTLLFTISLIPPLFIDRTGVPQDIVSKIE